VADARRYFALYVWPPPYQTPLRGHFAPAGNAAIAGASFFEFLVAIYGGYFGGGIGIMNLAMFAALGMTDIHEMNARKLFWWQ